MRVEVVIEVQADPAIETEIIGSTAIQIGDIPFAKTGGSIPHFLHHLANGGVLLRIKFGSAAAVVILVSRSIAVWVAPSQKSGSCW